MVFLEFTQRQVCGRVVTKVWGLCPPHPHPHTYTENCYPALREDKTIGPEHQIITVAPDISTQDFSKSSALHVYPTTVPSLVGAAGLAAGPLDPQRAHLGASCHFDVM